VVGSQATVLHTTNGGASWTQRAQSLPALPYLHGIAVVGATAATVVVVGDGGVMLRSTDSGVTWSQRPGATTVRLRDVHFPQVCVDPTYPQVCVDPTYPQVCVDPTYRTLG
jgi:photosystem II stability/assembly factor-like uncharacterized protein